MTRNSNPQSDSEEFDMDAQVPQQMTQQFIEKWFGERCESFDGGCCVCKKWKAFDFLFENPFVE